MTNFRFRIYFNLWYTTYLKFLSVSGRKSDASCTEPLTYENYPPEHPLLHPWLPKPHRPSSLTWGLTKIDAVVQGVLVNLQRQNPTLLYDIYAPVTSVFSQASPSVPALRPPSPRCCPRQLLGPAPLQWAPVAAAPAFPTSPAAPNVSSTGL